MQGETQVRMGRGGLAVLFAPLRVIQILAEAQESRGRLMTCGGGGGWRWGVLPQSPAQSTELFSSGRGGGQGERRQHQWPALDYSWTSDVSIYSLSRWISLTAIVQQQEER